MQFIGGPNLVVVLDGFGRARGALGFGGVVPGMRIRKVHRPFFELSVKADERRKPIGRGSDGIGGTCGVRLGDFILIVETARH